MSAANPAPLPESVAGRSALGPLDLALQHAARGWRVLPTRNKQPLTRHGVKDATCDPERLRHWWAIHPDAEPAVTGVDVLDVDRKPGQPDPLDALRSAGLDVANLPPGMYAGISRGGAGCHVFGVGNVGNGRPLPSVDGRGRETYVVALYDLPERDTITAAFPESVLTGSTRAAGGRPGLHEPPRKNPNPPASVVAKAREDVKAILADADALAQLSPGDRYDLPGYPDSVGWDAGLYLIAQRLAGIAAHPDTGYGLDEAEADFLTHAPDAEGTYDPRHKWREGARVPREYLTVEQMFPGLPDDNAADPAWHTGVFARLVAEAAEDFNNPPPVLKPGYFAPFGTPLMYGGVINTLVGPGGIGKTNLALLAAKAHAGHTLFVSMEKSRPALRRSAGWLDAATKRMLFVPDLDAATAAIEAIDAPADASILVILDSVASACAALGLNENEAGDVGKLEALLMKWNRAASVGCVVTLDHTGHEAAGRARGSSRKGQMVQGRVWVLRPERGEVTATCEKDNSGERGLPWTYQMTPDRGPVPVFRVIPPGATPSARVADDAARLLAALDAAPGREFPSGNEARKAVGVTNGKRYEAAAEYLEELGVVERPRRGTGKRAALGLRLLPEHLSAAVATGAVANRGTDKDPVYQLVGVHEPPVVSGNEDRGEGP